MPTRSENVHTLAGECDRKGVVGPAAISTRSEDVDTLVRGCGIKGEVDFAGSRVVFSCLSFVLMQPNLQSSCLRCLRVRVFLVFTAPRP